MKCDIISQELSLLQQVYLFVSFRYSFHKQLCYLYLFALNSFLHWGPGGLQVRIKSTECICVLYCYSISTIKMKVVKLMHEVSNRVYVQ